MIRQWPLLAYSALGLPLAMAMLPVYITAPKYYSDSLGVSLTALGAVLFLTRLVDTVQDPLIGWLVDRQSRQSRGWLSLMAISAGVLMLGMAMLFIPPVIESMVIWLAVSLLIVYTAHSFLNVCYLTWGARLTDDPAGRARVTGWREASGIIGVVIASVLPLVLVEAFGLRLGMGLFAGSFAAFLFLGLLITLTGSPRPIIAITRVPLNLSSLMRPTQVRHMYGFYLCNATAVAIPATLVLFYVDDVLQLQGSASMFLAAYFLAGLLTLPFWVKVSDRVGKRQAWTYGSLLACSALILSLTLQAGDFRLYLLVCLISGSALGADLALPPAMLADAIPPGQRMHTGIYFGVWALVTKFALAFAAGVTLPLLSLLGYTPGHFEGASALSWLYAGLPLVFKCFAALIVWSGFQSSKVGESYS